MSYHISLHYTDWDFEPVACSLIYKNKYVNLFKKNIKSLLLHILLFHLLSPLTYQSVQQNIEITISFYL